MLIEYLAIIPARSGSVGVKNKNIMPINNKPFLEYVLQIAENTKNIDGIFFSTDSTKYLQIFKNLKVKKDITHDYLRSTEISQSKSIPNEYIKECLEFLKTKNIVVKNIIILQITNPLITSFEIENAINIFSSSKYNYLVSVSKPIQHVGYMLNINEDKFNHIIEFKGANRQDYKDNIYSINGNLYIGRVNELVKNYDNKTIFLKQNETFFYHQDVNSGFQVDNYNDIILVESLLNSKNRIFLEKGWYIEKELFSLEELNFLKNEIYNYINTYNFDSHYTLNNKINNVYCLDKYDNRFIDFFNNHIKLNKIVNILLGSKVEILAIEVSSKLDGIELDTHIHQDNELFCINNSKAFTALIALDDISEINSGLKLWPGSNNRGLLRHYKSVKGTSIILDKNSIEKIGEKNFIINKLNKGDVQFHHCLTANSIDIRNLSRNVIIVRYKSVDSFIDTTPKDEYRDCYEKQ